MKLMFNTVDADGSGSIDRVEVGRLSKKMGWDLTDAELEAAVIEMDPSGDGEIDLGEFTGWMRRYTEGDDMVRAIFSAVDTDGSGVLDYEVAICIKIDEICIKTMDSVFKMMNFSLK